MVTLIKPKLRIGGIQPRHSPTGQCKLAVTRAATGVWLFNKAPGVTDAEARFRGSRNRLPGAANADTDNTFPYGNPTMFTDYWRFDENSVLQTIIPDSTEVTVYGVVKTADTNIGVTPSTLRGQIAGTYGNAVEKGWVFEFNSQSQARGYAIEADGSTQVNTASLVTSPNIWRIMRFTINATVADCQSYYSADGANGTPTTQTGGRALGSQRMTIGGRVVSGAAQDTGQVDIALIFTYAMTPTAPEDAAIVEQIRAQCALMTSITVPA